MKAIDPTPHNPVPLPKIKVPRLDSRTWKRLPEAEQKIIRRFLHWYAKQAVKGAEAAQKMQAISGHDPAYEGQLTYWSDCVKCIKWLMHRTTVRQEYLSLPDPTDHE